MKVKTKMRSRWLVLIVLAQLIVITEAAAVIYLYKDSGKTMDPQLLGGSDYATRSYSEETSTILAELHRIDSEWIEHSNGHFVETVQLNSETEEGRRQLAQLKAEQQLEFLQQMAELAAQQQALQDKLDSKAEAEIEAMGGIDATKDDVVMLPTEGSDSSANPDVSPENNSSSSAAPAGSAATESLEDETYFGQFKARYVCTCANCFKSGEWEGVSSGDCYIWADPEYIPSGITVTLDQGTSGSYTVHDAEGEVEGRSVVVFNPNHSEANGSMYLYPKITKKE